MTGALENLDFGYIWSQVVRLISDPYSNIKASLLILAIAVILVLIVALAVIIVATSWRRKPRGATYELEELQYLLSVLEGQELPERPEHPRATPSAARRKRGLSWLVALGSVGLAVLVIGVALGVTTGSSSVCTACHTTTPHSLAVRAGIQDAHKAVSCIDCHESSGPVGSATIEVPARLAHFLAGVGKRPKPTQYGGVASGACLRCHRPILTKDSIDEERGIKMAHSQPVRAGAQCRDCHTSTSGVVSALTAGMATCMRCHDGKAQSADCSFCHMKDVGTATTPHVEPSDLKGTQLIATPDCSACHDMKTKCDPCHGGQRMPHTQLFMWWGHAREGAKDLWFNGGKRCGTCHTATRNPCTKCHTVMPGHPVREWPTMHPTNDPKSACNSCHGPKAYMSDRDLCAVCHSKPYITQ